MDGIAEPIPTERVQSSYSHSIDYSSIFRAACFLMQPKRIVEFGILRGFSLAALAESAPAKSHIEAYDIFEGFEGNHADVDEVRQRFQDDARISIAYGNLYDSHTFLESEPPIDLMHVDVANNGKVVRYVVDKLLPLMSDRGLIIFEGGTPARDDVDWMHKYAREPMCPELEAAMCTHRIRACTLGDVPGLTLVQRCF